LDYALGTPHVVNSVITAGYEAFKARYHTDHRSYYIDFSTDILFGIYIQPMARYEPRILRSNNPNQVTAYLKAKHKILVDHKMFFKEYNNSSVPATDINMLKELIKT
jgi:hypothetical protein